MAVGRRNKSMVRRIGFSIGGSQLEEHCSVN